MFGLLTFDPDVTFFFIGVLLLQSEFTFFAVSFFSNWGAGDALAAEPVALVFAILE